MPGHAAAYDVSALAPPSNPAIGVDTPRPLGPPSADEPAVPRARRSDRVVALPSERRQGDVAGAHGQRVRRRLALALADTTPTLLPELLRSFSRQASHLASHPANAVDNNPFIMREWLIVSQVLHAAAQTLENRFEGLFLGL